MTMDDVCPTATVDDLPSAVDLSGMDDIELLRRAIEASGMHPRDFAVKVLIRDERTIRRWLNQESPMPKIVAEFLADYLRKAEWRK